MKNRLKKYAITKIQICQIMRWIGMFRIKEQEEKCPLAKNQYNNVC